MDKQTLSKLKLWLVPNIGALRFNSLMSFFKDADGVFHAAKSALMQIKNIRNDIADYITLKQDDLEKRLEQEIDLIEKNNVNLVTINDSAYPDILKTIYDPPYFLYMKGEYKTSDETAIGIVGTRKCSSYGAIVTKKIARDLAEKGITIVSGLARGIDTYAHTAACECKGRTIAVLGSGLSCIYPPENSRLAEDILNNGVLMAEVPMLSAPEKFNFPMRNRIISGLSKGTVVVEACKRSGALITSKYALEQGREVFAVPGNITNSRSFGPHALIKDGAKLVTCVEDILEEIFEYKDFFQKSDEKEKNNKGSKLLKKMLSENENQIYDLLNTDHSMQIEDIMQQTNISMIDIIRILGSLELKGLIKQLPGKNYMANGI